MSKDYEVINVPVADIGFSEVALRTHKMDADDIVHLWSDIKQRGILNLPSVVKAEEEGKYNVADGARRLTALKYGEELGELTDIFPDGKINVQLITVEDNIDLLCNQLSGNVNVKQTGNREYINSLFLIVTSKKYSMSELAEKAGMSETYIEKLFSTLKIPENVYNALQEKDVGVGNIISIAKLKGKVSDEELMDTYVELAATETTGEFAETVQNKLDEIKEGKKREEPKFELVPKLLTRDELEVLLIQAQTDFEANGSPENEVRYQVFKEIWQIDDVTAAERQKDWEAKQEEKKRKAAERKAKRESAKLEDTIKDLEDQGFSVKPKEEK